MKIDKTNSQNKAVTVIGAISREYGISNIMLLDRSRARKNHPTDLMLDG